MIHPSATINNLWDGWCAMPPPADGQHRYLLVNQAAWNAHRTVIRDLRSLPRQALLGQGGDACGDGATPFVIRIDGRPDEGARAWPLRAVCQTGQWACALHLIDSPLPLQGLAHALSERCLARLSDGQEMLLRYFDTRVLAAMCDVLRPTQMQDLVSCTSAWWFANRGGEWVSMNVLDWPGEERFQAPWHLSLEQEHALLDASEADAMIDLLTRQGQPALLALPYGERYPAIRELLAQGKAWGLDGTTDLSAYCTLGLSQGRTFSQAEPWQSALQQVREGRMSFIQAIEQARREEA
ncbi:DUF4123 domain-containing protein [Caldimonas manganoxidans]|uniref:DUF4123 domain-containing protein n=1 Tax=Caldimonas manganoxidans TaxID=196015 RepID=UPI0005275E28|nr:DUF4123 domain-containing protein [Caldimonas manganoxidans]